MKIPKYQWRKCKVAGEQIETLANALKLPQAVARILVARGITTHLEATRFLKPDLNQHLSHPYLFPGAQAAAQRLWSAIHAQRDIVVFGDFDADGVAAAAVLTHALQRFGGKAETFLPERDPEGYGLTFEALTRCCRQRGGKWPALLVTVDCGITSVAEIAYLIKQGVDVIITDHHEPGPELPQGAILVNPKLQAVPGTESLCGAGVAFKVVHAMAEIGKTSNWYQGAPFCGELLPAVGLATVTDIVPLTGENRLFVHTALRTWERYAGEGLRALLKRSAARAPVDMDASLFGFVLGPRLNAAGRMGSAMIAYELLTTHDRQRAAELAAQLEGFNGERRGVEARMLAAAQRQCGLEEPNAVFDDAAVVVAGEGTHAGENGWHVGVMGIVAARLCDTTARPAAVIVLDAQGEGRGSVRTCAGYHALEALHAARATLSGFGGHDRAAGFSIKPGCFEQFRNAFCRACQEQAEHAAPMRELVVDGWLQHEEITPELYTEQQRLAPFGHGNPAPHWGVRNVLLERVQPVGATRRHLQLSFGFSNGVTVRGVWFRQGAAAETLRALIARPVDMVFKLQCNNFTGTPLIELNITDLATSSA